MASQGHVILVESADGSSDKLAQRLTTFHVEPLLARDLSEARSILEQRRTLIMAVLVPTDLPTHNLKHDIKSVCQVGPASGLMFVSVGKAPTPSERKKLRAAGVKLALWEPYDDGTLRFQINRALGGDRDDHARREPRVPTYLLARIYQGERHKDAVVYSLSEGGSFLETPRASMEGAEIDVELRLPGQAVRVHGTVVFANVPGNLQRPNLPLGMGVRFTHSDPADAKALHDYIAQRIEQLEV